MTINKELIENIKWLKKSVSEISVYDLNYYTAIELYYNIAKKLNEVINELLRFEGVLSEEIIKQNEKLLYLLGEGLKIEVGKKIQEMFEDGTIESIINNTIFNKLQTQVNELIKRKEEIANASELGLISKIEYVFKDYENTNTKLDGTTRKFVNNQTDYAKNNAQILQNILNSYKRVYIPKGDFVFCDYNEETTESIIINVPDNTVIFGDGGNLTNIYGVRFRGSTSNLTVHDINFNGITDITPIGKLKATTDKDFNNSYDFDYKQYNKLLKRPDINYNTPLIFSPNFDNKEIKNINVYNCSFKNVTTGILIGDHLGSNENNFDSKNINVRNCYGENLIYHLTGIQRGVNVSFINNKLIKSYVGMLLDSSRNSKNIVCSNNIAEKCLNLAKLEVNPSGGVSKNEIISNNVYTSWDFNDLNYNNDYVIKIVGSAIVDNNLIEINTNFDDIFSITQTSNDIQQLITNNNIIINKTLKARHSICNAIVRVYSFNSNIDNFSLLIKSNNVKVNDILNTESLRFIDFKVSDNHYIKTDIVVENNTMDNVCEFCFIDNADLKNLYVNSNKINFVDGYWNVVTLLKVGKSLKTINIKNNSILFSRGCILNANYFRGDVISSTNDINIIIENNEYLSKYLATTFDEHYNETNKSQFIHLSNFVNKIKNLVLKNNITNVHESIIYTTLNTNISTLLIKENLFEFIGTRTGISSIFFSNPVEFGVICNNDFIKKTYDIELDGKNKILWKNNSGASGITVQNIITE